MSGELVGVGIDGTGRTKVFYRCPECQDNHQVAIAPDRHSWNGDRMRPTIFGSVMVEGPMRYVESTAPVGVCHSYVEDGQARFLGDCTHSMANQTADLLPWWTA